MLSARARRAARAVASLAIALWTSAPATADDGTSGEPPLTTDQWREPAPPLELHWRLLALPEQVVELAFMPVGALVGLVEDYRLDLRVVDLLQNDAGTIKFTPGLKVGFGDGFGVGGSLKLYAARVGTAYKLNGDVHAGVSYERSLAWAEGRTVQLEADYRKDSNVPYYGLGNDTAKLDRRALGADVAFAQATADLTPLGQLDWTGWLQLGWRRESLRAGSGTGAPVGEDPMDSVAPPPGFGQAIDYPYVRANLRYDMRDNVGTPTQGYVAELTVGATRDVGADRSYSAFTASASGSYYVALLPLQRVLAASGGVTGALPMSEGDTLPFHELPTLGRERSLRGYSKTRFRDQLAWWASLEYRWMIWEYLDTRAGLSPTVFVDLGRVSDTLGGLARMPIHYTYGVGLRAAHETTAIFHLNVAMSPEGIQFGFAAGAEL